MGTFKKHKNMITDKNKVNFTKEVLKLLIDYDNHLVGKIEFVSKVKDLLS